MAKAVPEREEIVGRMITLSDALVAIAMTLLVLSIDVPDVPAGSNLGSALEGLWPEFFSWLLSFVILAILWRAQHYPLVALKSAGGFLIAVHFVFLATISVIPFTSGLLGEFGDDGLATAIYAGNIALAVLALDAFDWLAKLRGHHLPGADPIESLADLAPALVFALSIPIALLWSAEIAQYSWITILLVRPLATRLERARRA